MARFIAEELGNYVVVHVDLEIDDTSNAALSGSGSRASQSHPSSIETLVEGVIWLKYGKPGRLKGVTIRLMDGHSLRGLDRSVLRRLASKLGLACYRQLRREYLQFAKSLEAFGGLLAKA